MAKPLALIASDLHIRNYDRIWARHPNLVGDTRFALQQILDIAAQYEGLRYVLLAGDICDGKLHRSDALSALTSFISGCLRRQHVLFVQGDHEYADPPLLSSLFNQPARVMHASGHTFQLGDLTLYGLDYVPLGEASTQLAKIPPVDIVLTHQKWRDFLGKFGDCQFSDIPAGHCKLLITGDFHVSAVRRVGAMTVLSPGSVCMQDLGETPDKYVYILHDDLSLVPLPLLTRRRCDISVQSESDLEATLPEIYAIVKSAKEQLPPDIAAPIVRVAYPQSNYDVKRWVDSALGLSCHLFFDPQPVMTEEQAQQAKEQQERQSVVLAGGLAGVIRTYFNDDPLIAESAIRVAMAENKDEEALRLFQEFQAQGEAQKATQC
jgi:predicted phosphodiesterase